jgi:lipopolysaccharide transport system ATP-binding protein
MSKPRLRLERVGKCYHIYANPQARFRQALLNRLPWLPRSEPLYREYWALRDVSFTLQRGEALGVIGRNGAGKSTLLQIVAGTLDTTEGIVETSGRITALLELGSGFNPEFNGRENVFLNAQILGLSRADALARFDEVAAFADIGDFIDQPVKTYSSGMTMRLAFAVQTIFEPDILIVDEALSVGDAKFQDKCFRKIRSLRDSGVAILLVSHDVNAVTTFCDRAILLDGGRLVEEGTPRDVARRYIERLYTEPAQAEPAPPAVVSRPAEGENDGAGYRFGNRAVEILGIEIVDEIGGKTSLLNSGGRYRITQRVRANADVDDLATGFMIRNARGTDLFGVTNKTAGVATPPLKKGDVIDVSITVTAWLAAGDYFLQAANGGPGGIQYDCYIDAVHFTVLGTPELFTTSVINLRPELEVARVESGASGPTDRMHR